MNSTNKNASPLPPDAKRKLDRIDRNLSRMIREVKRLSRQGRDSANVAKANDQRKCKSSETSPRLSDRAWVRITWIAWFLLELWRSFSTSSNCERPTLCGFQFRLTEVLNR